MPHFLKWKKNHFLHIVVMLSLYCFICYVICFVHVLKVVTCGNMPLESSFQKVPRCVYTSTSLYEYRGWSSKAVNPTHRRFTWGLRSLEVSDSRLNLLLWLINFVLLEVNLLSLSLSLSPSRSLLCLGFKVRG